MYMKKKFDFKIFSRHLVSILLLFLAVLMIKSVEWAINTYDSLDFTEIVYHLKVPIEGTSTTILYSYFIDAFLFSVVCTGIIYGIVWFFCTRYPNKKVSMIIAKRHILIGFVVFLVLGSFSFVRVNALDYVLAITTQSTFIEEHYVDGRTIDIEFPEEKRNLIYIYLESMEATYFSDELGGYMYSNLLPNLTTYFDEGTSFSNSASMGGLYTTQNTTWTIAAMVAQTTGLPLSVPIDSNRYYGEKPFLPGAYAIGDILASEGYNQELLIGSKAKFGARNLLFSQHGNYKLNDYEEAIQDGRLPKGYFEWWGYEDSKLFDFAKEDLLELAAQPEPFNLTLLTTNTHFQDGYKEPGCNIDLGDVYYNAIACSDQQVYDFVEWVKEQDFYENTTIVIVGDHLSMNKGTFDGIAKTDRSVFNLFINSAATPTQTNSRVATTMDMFPSTLASMGVTIEGNQLGLGVNLFSDKKTLAEEYGLQTVNQELKYLSKFYNDSLLAVKEK